jgi:uncharacterized membrane protein
MLGYVYMHGMGWGWGILMTLVWLALLGLLLGVVLAAVRDRRAPSARDRLDHRLAAGEITVDDYERSRAAMASGGSDPSLTGPPATA